MNNDLHLDTWRTYLVQKGQATWRKIRCRGICKSDEQAKFRKVERQINEQRTSFNIHSCGGVRKEWEKVSGIMKEERRRKKRRKRRRRRMVLSHLSFTDTNSNPQQQQVQKEQSIRVGGRTDEWTSGYKSTVERRIRQNRIGGKHQPTCQLCIEGLRIENPQQVSH